VNDFLKELIRDYKWHNGVSVYYKCDCKGRYVFLRINNNSYTLGCYVQDLGSISDLEVAKRFTSPLENVTDEEFLFFKMNQDKDLTVISYSDMIDLIKNI
jgi:hypothetical protein